MKNLLLSSAPGESAGAPDTAVLLKRIEDLEAKLAAAPGAPEQATALDPAPMKVMIVRPQGATLNVPTEEGRVYGIGADPDFTREGTIHEFPAHHARRLIEHGLAKEAPAGAKVAQRPAAPAKPKGGNLGALAAFLIGLWTLGFGLWTPQARAQQSALIGDFQITNTLANGVSVVGYPTNTAILSTNTLVYDGTTNSTTTNNIGVGTGGFLNIGNYSDLSLDFTCFPTFTGSTNSDQITIQLIRSHVQNPPYAGLFQWWNTAGYIQSTNQGGTNSIYFNPWESAKALPSQLSVTITGIGAGGDTNAFHWHTNLSNLLGKEGAQWIGCYSITNGSTNALASATILSNCDLTLSGKYVKLFQ